MNQESIYSDKLQNINYKRPESQTLITSEIESNTPRLISTKKKLNLTSNNSKSYFKTSKNKLGVINEEDEPNSIKNSQRSKHPLWTNNPGYNIYHIHETRFFVQYKDNFKEKGSLNPKSDIFANTVTALYSNKEIEIASCEANNKSDLNNHNSDINL